ncbi:hypothetical protein K488DRAFT_71938 [Vararia minispora EC-137]|uniref:Uncharacterized protein n=1 Tax=Vararia minispora EC-137 TaxID=1314806 RepID=A0ACB8QGG7_9AGAM|nr:hypothetical protein K488DRAFT_71938 [Vararia minispora EC-137]
MPGQTRTLSILMLPLDILERVFDKLEFRTDLLSFALTCSTLRSIIIPAHLDRFRIVVASIHDAEFFVNATLDPEFALRIRDLTLVNESNPSSLERRYERSDSKASSNSGKHVNGREILLAVKAMKRLRRLCLITGISRPRVPPISGEELLATCSELPLLDQVHMDWGGRVPSTDWYLKTSNMRTLNVSFVFPPGAAAWSSFCGCLLRSPLLEELTLPTFVWPHDAWDLTACQSLPHLSALRRFTVRRIVGTGITLRVLEFLEDHPGIEDLRWEARGFSGSISVHFASSRLTLPNLKRLRDTTAPPAFLQFFLSSKARFSLRLEALELGLNGTFPLSLLKAVHPDSLRVLRLSCLDSYHTLRKLSKMFPHVEALTLPTQGAMSCMTPSFTKRVIRTAFAKLIGASQHSLRYPSVQDVCALFPHLRRFRGMGFDSAVTRHGLTTKDDGDIYFSTYKLTKACRNDARRALVSLHRRFPQLEAVDGWVIRDGDPVIFADTARTSNSWRRFAGVRFKVTLKKDTISAAYAVDPYTVISIWTGEVLRHRTWQIIAQQYNRQPTPYDSYAQ